MGGRGADLLGLVGPIERAGEKGGGDWGHILKNVLGVTPETSPVREVTITIPCSNSVSKTSTIYF